MRALAYARFELLRTFREGKLLAAAIAVPLLLYFLLAVPKRHVHDLAMATGNRGTYLLHGQLSRRSAH